METATELTRLNDEAMKGFRLAPQQRRLWRLRAWGGSSRSLCVVEIEGELDRAALRRAAGELVARHEVLRTRFYHPPEMKFAFQIIEEEMAPAWEVVDLPNLAERENYLDERVREELCAWEDPERDAPLRLTLLAFNSRRSLLIVSLPTLCADAQSLLNLARELAESYAVTSAARDRVVAQPGEVRTIDEDDVEAPLQYVDFAEWQNDLIDGDGGGPGLAYWRNQDFISFERLMLPLEGEGEANGAGFETGVCRFTLDSEEADGVMSAARAHEVTEEMFLLACWQTLLGRLSGLPEIVTAVRSDGRVSAETTGALGLYARWLPLKTRFGPSFSFAEALAQVVEAARGARTWQQYFFWEDLPELERAVEEGGPFPVGFEYDRWEESYEAGDLRFSVRRLESATDRLKLKLTCARAGLNLTGALHFDRGLYAERNVRRLVERFVTLSCVAARDPRRPVGDLGVLGEGERRELLSEWNWTRAEVGGETCVSVAFERQVAETPDRVAVSTLDEQLSYAELNASANRLARRLRRLGVGAESLVALYVERSAQMLVSLVGVLKAGGAYVPLDVGQPKERLGSMLADAQPTAVITTRRLAEALPINAAQVIRLDADLDDIAKCEASDLRVAASPSCLAYVIYTSGSAGLPKGVMVTHGSLLNLLAGLESAVYERAGSRVERVSLNAPLAFDSSVKQVMQLLRGRTISVAPEEARRDGGELLRHMARAALDAFDCTPAQLRLLLAAGLGERAESEPTVFLVGGEAIDESTWATLKGHSRIRYFNVYGPTECTVDATACLIGEAPTSPVIGRPLSNVRAYVCDERLELAPVGVFGELLIGGVGVARGYLSRPDLTAERFLPDPFSEKPGERLYRTGDVARHLSEGELEFQGRLDFQVKIRGNRVELGEIEAALGSHPSVAEAVVVAREDETGDKRLAAYAVLRAGQFVAADELRQYLRNKLPDYMLPAAYVTLDKMPLTRNGKVDRRALPPPECQSHLTNSYEPPVGETEMRLAQIWADALKLPHVSRYDNFFELGGHSLLAITVIERMRREGLPADVGTLFTSPSLQALAEAIEGKGEVRIETPPNLIPPGSHSITPEMLPLVNLKQHEIDKIVAGVPGGAANVQDIYPLAPLQEGILFHYLMSLEGDTYLQPTLIVFETRALLDCFVQAMRQVITRHDILRTAVVWEGLPEPVQVVWREARLVVEEVALDPSSGETTQQLRERFDPRRARLDIRQAPLMRCVVANDAAEGRWLLLCLSHHLAIDHTTVEIMMQEAQAYLLGEDDRLPEPLPFRNFVGQARMGASQFEHEAFFRTMLGDVEEPTAPFGLLDAQGDGFNIKEWRIELEMALSRRMREQARVLGVSAASLCHLAWALALRRVSGRDDVVFGTVLFGRMHGGNGTDRALGLFINTLPVRIRIGREEVGKSVKQVHELLAGLMRHEHASLALAQRCSGVAAPTPLFSSLLNYLHDARKAELSPKAAAVWAGVKTIDSQKRTNYPLVFSIDDLGEGFTLKAQSISPVDPGRVCEIMRVALERLVDALQSAPETALGAIDVLPAAESRRVLVEWNATKTDYPAGKCVHELFEAQVERGPDAIALEYYERRLTYSELNARANCLAHELREMGVKPGDQVAILLERSIELVIAQLATLKCGAAYAPIDPTLPDGRQVFMIFDCGARAIITTSGASLPEVISASRVDIDDPDRSKAGAGNLNLPMLSEMKAYVMYTSGSTGNPKGVMAPHRAISRLVLNCGYADFNAGDCVAFAANPSFDAATMEVWAPLLNGGRMLLVDQNCLLEPSMFGEELKRRGVSVLWLTVGLFNQYADILADSFRGLRYLIVGGDALDPRIIARTLRRSPPRHLVNGYGPTETTTFAITHEIAEVDDGAQSIPLGRPISNTQIYILDAGGQPAPIGVAGEIYIGGAGVALGYLNRPELTGERFLPDPFSQDPAARIYKTGDLGRWRSDGRIEFLGRNDSQVKIRGFRVEPGEIEARLAGHPGVRDAVVLARVDGDGAKRLVGYYTGEEVGTEVLRNYLSSRLPEYMVPSAYVYLESLPLTPNGKLDRRALPTPEGQSHVRQVYEPPVGETEIRLAQIWAGILKLDGVGRHDNFFDLGGHSLLATQIIGLAREAFQIELPLRRLFESPTLAGLAAAIEQCQTAPREDAVAPIRSLGSRSGDEVERLFAELDQISQG